MILDRNTFLIYEAFQALFIRIGNDVYISEPGETSITHKTFAKKEKILEKIEITRLQSEDEVDGGMIFVNSKLIKLASEASSLDIPLTKRAREITLQRLRYQNPSFNISKLVS